MQLSLFILSCVVACGLFCFGIDARYIKRNAEFIVCSKSTPCGWEVYKPYERTITTFVRSPCDCPNGSRCVQTSDDISISAYVHRCVPDGIDGSNWNYDSVEEQI